MGRAATDQPVALGDRQVKNGESASDGALQFTQSDR